VCPTGNFKAFRIKNGIENKAILAIILDIVALWHNVKTDKENKEEEK
jgi:hypothetical protein